MIKYNANNKMPILIKLALNLSKTCHSPFTWNVTIYLLPHISLLSLYQNNNVFKWFLKY
jgi:hypothetical protein